LRKVLVVFCLVTLLTFLTCNSTQGDSTTKERDRNHTAVVFDKSGIPYYNYSYTGRYSIGLQGSPHFVSEQALKMHKEYQKNSNESAKIYFINNVNWLVSTNMLKNEGSFSTYEFSFPWRNGNHTVEAPWRNGMANGEAINPLLKAYELTGNKTYLHTAKMLLNCFYVDVKDGGVTYKTPHSGWWYEEYASRNSTKEPRVLNGMIWAVLGIKDYYEYSNDSKAKYLYDQGILALKNDLPKYDNNGSSFYDRLGLEANSFYKTLHVTLLKKLYDITQEQIFKTYHDKWNNYNLAN
jgi:heparosan-N-sulfate-glucuronate 5-epimerase